MNVKRIKLKESLKEWAFNTTDLNDEALTKLVAKTPWLQNDSNLYLNPTVKQLGNFASHLHIPFGNLLLSEPPQIDDIRLAFRTQKNAPANVSLTARDIIYEMKRKQAWFKEESGLTNAKLSFINSAAGFNNTDTLEKLTILVTLNHFSTARELYNDLRNQLAYLGVLNMQKGGAGLGNNRPLEIKETRAFVLLDEYAPLIFINQKDSYTARIFSLIHEFIHLLHGTDELLSDENKDLKEEQNINKITAAFLMPSTSFKKVFKRSNCEIVKTARYFNTSPEATLIRAKELKLINQNTQITALTPAIDNKKINGGNPYNNALSQNDRRYMSALISAQDQGLVQPTQAAALIGISYKMLDKTIDFFNEREAFI
ncbi:ImmA/IrrE family metallo-endopeptidase [Companilactobacillus farciminis]|uniref:ImmA/IrrE family metallo-endopeptidase n=1 Tax=Companilactobacillus farciminis TaxID=1612 RepID=UPI0023315070|nr:ImmA/IrrE family metallo-endopeptidase [Companilactobacillus farciminis]WCG35739.1 ImmA/IrrE family metallo-endopeptidase [Companilactobacillus farciminis]